MTLRSFIMTLVALGLLLPLAICVFLGVEALLGAMGDAAGQHVLRRVRLAGLILWVLDLVFLVIMLGIQQIGTLPDSNSEKREEK